MSASGAPPNAGNRPQGGQRDNTNARRHGLDSDTAVQAFKAAPLTGKVLTPPVIPSGGAWARYFGIDLKSLRMAAARHGADMAAAEGVRWVGLSGLTRGEVEALLRLEFQIRFGAFGREELQDRGQLGGRAIYHQAELLERYGRRTDALRREVTQIVVDAAMRTVRGTS